MSDLRDEASHGTEAHGHEREHAHSDDHDPWRSLGISRAPDELGRPRFWRSLDELHDTDAFRRVAGGEFVEGADLPPDDLSRRNFLKVMGASMALAGLTACTRKPEERIVPYVKQPEQLVAGVPLYFATAVTLGGYAKGVLVESHEGRPTKIEGNPDHPASLGATDVFMQASVLSLYDPDRSQVVTRNGDVSNWDTFLAEMAGELRAKGMDQVQGAGLRVLTGAITSPTLITQLQQFLKRFPKARWHAHEPVGRDNARAGATAAFGRDVATIYNFEKANVIVSLDDNFLFESPGSVRYARQFINGRRVRDDRTEMNRLHVAESTPTITGAMADARLTLKPSQIETVARLVAHALGAGPEVPGADPALISWANSAAADLKRNAGACVVLAGEGQPPAVHALGHWLNQQLGNVGKTVSYREPIEASEGVGSLAELVSDIDAGNIDLLLILGGNPAYNAPADLRLTKERIEKVRLRAHLSHYNDETSFFCHWHLPMSHSLESWGDARAFDGTATIIQPLIAPLYPTRSAQEVLSALLGGPTTGYEIVRAHWTAARGADGFDAFWEKSLNDGVVAERPAPAQVSARALDGPATAPSAPAAANSAFEIVFRPDPTIWDGCFANNGWLQELPKPLTKLTWDNAAFMRVDDAKRLGLENGRLVKLAVDGREVTAPVSILPGQPNGVVTAHLGYGRTRAGRVGSSTPAEPRGFDAYTLRHSERPWFAGGLTVTPISGQRLLASTQGSQLMHGRELIHVEDVEHFRKELGSAKSAKTVSLDLYPQYKYEGNAWGMVIDQNACIGCNACIVACVSENNIPVVGKEQVAKGREMHWLRVDAYYGGDNAADAQGPYFQPVPCMHCEKAPCEVVCPVNATVHDHEGINNMVYNRCVGTRYCSNNCPYKVRRFNFFDYHKDNTESLSLMHNPDVTVRSRGVMEKCSYCIQRINLGRIESKKYEARIADAKSDKERADLAAAAHEAIASIQTACAQACPTQAIIFGNINDPDAAVAKLKKQPQDYVLLEELNTRPRTSYLPRFKNPVEG